MTNLVLLAIVAIGLATSLGAILLVRGTGLGLRTDLPLGVVGAFAGSGLLPALGIPLGQGLGLVVASAGFGAVALLVLVRMVGLKRRLSG